jgi:TonB family protein
MKRQILSFIFALLVSSAVAQTAPQSLIVQRADVPLYPPIPKIAHISGTVQVEITVKNGVVTDTQVKSSAHQMLVTATLENLKTWKFAPDMNATFVTTYTYELTKDEAPVPENPRIEMQLPTLVKVIAKPTKPMCNDCRSAIPMEHFDNPKYPQLARVARVFGTVEVEVTVKGGTVVNTEVKSGPKLLAQATMDNIKSWRFQPDVNTIFTTKFKYQIETKRPLQTDPQIELQLPYSVTITTVPPIIDSQAIGPKKTEFR